MFRAGRVQYDELGSRVNRWAEEEEIELLMLGSDAAYRLQELGSTELNWAAIGQHLGHTAGGARRTFFHLTLAPAQGAKRE